MTYAERYNRKVEELMPHMAADLYVSAEIESPALIDEIVFRRSEYLGGMADVICAVVNQEISREAK